MTHNQRKFYFILDLKANIIIKINFIILKLFVFDFSKNLAIIGIGSGELNPDKETVRHFIQQLIYVKT